MIYGYIRVSSKDQNEARQIDAMLKAGIPEENLFIDKASGKDFDRLQYVKMIRMLRKGDVVFVQSIDRLGRNYTAIIDEWNAIVKKIKADIVVLDMPILDTRNGKDLMGTLISDIVLQLLSYVAQTEREKIKTRQAEGIAAAKARGVRFGRPRSDMPENFFTICERYERKELTLKQVSEALNIPVSTFRYRKETDFDNARKGMDLHE